eukprot:GEMP01083056.1.p2 GENE.GEMP01083056.1~~GEMP01083056.1.p2  ORF type:complete len:158 (+),score=42.46 GEMP01083056.1:354-827(+)
MRSPAQVTEHKKSKSHQAAKIALEAFSTPAEHEEWLCERRIGRREWKPLSVPGDTTLRGKKGNNQEESVEVEDGVDVRWMDLADCYCHRIADGTNASRECLHCELCDERISCADDLLDHLRSKNHEHQVGWHTRMQIKEDDRDFAERRGNLLYSPPP